MCCRSFKTLVDRYGRQVSNFNYRDNLQHFWHCHKSPIIYLFQRRSNHSPLTLSAGSALESPITKPVLQHSILSSQIIRPGFRPCLLFTEGGSLQPDLLSFLRCLKHSHSRRGKGRTSSPMLYWQYAAFSLVLHAADVVQTAQCEALLRPRNGHPKTP